MKKTLFKIKNDTVNSIENKLNELIRQYHHRFCNNILDIIHEQIRGIPEYKIEDLIQDELTNEIETKITEKINKLNDSLENIIHRINYNNNNLQTLNALIDDNYELNQLLKQLSLELDLEEITNQFKYKIRRKLSYYCEPFNEVSSRNLESVIEDISYDITRRIRNIEENLQEEYNQIIKTETKKSLIKMKDNIKNLEQEQKLTSEEIQILAENLKYSGFNLIQENDRLYVEEIDRFKNNPNYKKFSNLPNYKVEIKYYPENKILKSIDNRLTFSINNNKYQALDIKLNKFIIIDRYGITLSSADKKNYMAIIKNKDNYIFYYNHQTVTSLNEIDIIISNVMQKTPQYYNELLKDPTFKMIDNKVKKHIDDTKEIYFDDVDNKIKINPKTKDIVIKKLRLFGFFPIEKEDGLYLKDLITNEEYKMKNTAYLLTSKSPQNKMKIYTSLTIVDEKITSPFSFFNNGTSDVYIIDNMSKFIFNINNKTYKVHLTETGLKFKTEKQISFAEDELISIIKNEFPFIAEHFEQHLLKVKKEQNKETPSKNNIPKKIDITSQQVIKPTIKIPTFNELEYLASTYEIFYDSEDENKIKIRDINTGIVQTDQSIITKATFANIWLSAAGIKRTPGDARFGEAYAFSSSSKELYNIICKKLLESIQTKGTIDTVELFKFICDNNIFNHGEQIITNLFSTENSVKEINDLFLQATGTNSSTKSPIVLSSIEHAYELAYHEARGSARKV